MKGNTMSHPLCEGTLCAKSTGTIRLVPLCSSTPTRICASCYYTEMSYNEDLPLQDQILPKEPFSLYPLFSPTEDDINYLLNTVVSVPTLSEVEV